MVGWRLVFGLLLGRASGVATAQDGMGPVGDLLVRDSSVFVARGGGVERLRLPELRGESLGEVPVPRVTCLGWVRGRLWAGGGESDASGWAGVWRAETSGEDRWDGVPVAAACGDVVFGISGAPTGTRVALASGARRAVRPTHPARS